MPSPSSRAEHLGPVINVRFVQLVDGRKILQVFQETEFGWIWRTPETVAFSALGPREANELREAVPPMHRDNGDGV